jgi:hypothetical protein
LYPKLNRHSPPQFRKVWHLMTENPWPPRCPPSGFSVPSPLHMAAVAQSVEHLVVVQDVAGSSPVGRPFSRTTRGCLQRYPLFIGGHWGSLALIGAIPAPPNPDPGLRRPVARRPSVPSAGHIPGNTDHFPAPAGTRRSDSDRSRRRSGARPGAARSGPPPARSG